MGQDYGAIGMIHKIPTYQKFWWGPTKSFSGDLLKVLAPVHINYRVLTICINYHLYIHNNWYIPMARS